MKKITLFPAVELYLGRNILTLIPQLCQQNGYRAALIFDRSLPLTLQGELFPIDLKKTREAKEILEDQLLANGFGRDSVFVAIGGGTLTDLVGFVAATYLRGVPLILVPTTLLAMVDAAFGGKNGVDTPLGKNLIGTFYLPKAIVIDLDFLKTLPKKEQINGLSEILKIALVFDPSILKADLEEQIFLAIQAKVAVVEQDPQESGLRRILNFGHTVAHAIEFCANFSISHGEAVSLGCVAESYLSKLMGLLLEEEFLQIVKLFPRFRWSFDRQKLLNAMSRDKKNQQGSIRFVLLDKIGHACEFDGAYCTPVPLEKIHEMFTFMEQNYV